VGEKVGEGRKRGGRGREEVRRRKKQRKREGSR